jgi:hypothetical protein
MLARYFPSAEKLTDRTWKPGLPQPRSSFPAAASHTTIIPSSPTEATVLPSGDRAASWTRPRCPRRQRSSFAVAASHKRTVPSKPDEARILRSAEAVRRQQDSWCPASRRQLTRRQRCMRGKSDKSGSISKQ